MHLTGSCLCGGIGFELDGWASPVQACHASRCRKATGALYSPEVAASAAAFRWVGDEGLIRQYDAPILHEPPAYRRCFCDRCGSPLPVVIAEAGIVILQAGILDGTAELPVFRHAFVGQKSPCCDITDGLPQFDGQPPAPDPSVLLG
ncbi:GFA family protein [Pseudooceanicola sp. C21-150M6]|uniref:GFA family protein n=1 Tax=Pseudooceanicola sp. C21-150M6 TaxID=3434355 RepID=UPI003D7F6B62